MRRRVLDSYARESPPGSKRNVSIHTQHEINTQVITELDANPGQLLSDQGKNAWTTRHGGWHDVDRRLSAGTSDGVVIYGLARFLHHEEDVARILAWAKDGHLVYDSDMGYDLNSPAGRADFTAAARGEQDYRRRLSDDVRRGNREKAARGEGRRGRYRPSGFEEDGTTVRESERPFLRDAARRILAGEQWQAVVDRLTAQGFYSPAQDHTAECDERRAALVGVQYRQYRCDCPRRPWVVESLRTALLAPRMAGYAKVGADATAGRLPGEPILDPPVWRALRALVESRRGRPPVDIYLCTGRDSPIRCSDCGGYFTVNSSGRGATYPDGETRRYYRVSKSGCGRTIADWRALDKAIESMVIDRLSSAEQLDEIQRVQEARAQRTAPHERELVRLEALRDHWNAQLTKGHIAPEQHGRMLDDVARKIRQEQQALKAFEHIPVVRLTAAEAADFRREWKSATPAQKRERLRQAYAGFRIFVTPGSAAETDVRYRISEARPIPLEA